MNTLNNLEAIVATDRRGGIARSGSIPWKCARDMIFFKTKTEGHYVVMGTNTLLSLPRQSPLKNRINVVVTTRASKMIEAYGWDSDIHFVDEVGTLALINESPDSKFFIIGGKQIYAKFLNNCSKIWVSIINHNYNCDLFLDYDFSKHRKTVHFSDDEFTILCYEK